MLKQETSLPGKRIPALHTNRILFRNSLPLAKQLNSDIQYLQGVNENQQWEINKLLTRKCNPAEFIQAKSNYSN